jgi:hypothetical protein
MTEVVARNDTAEILSKIYKEEKSKYQNLANKGKGYDKDASTIYKELIKIDPSNIVYAKKDYKSIVEDLKDNGFALFDDRQTDEEIVISLRKVGNKLNKELYNGIKNIFMKESLGDFEGLMGHIRKFLKSLWGKYYDGICGKGKYEKVVDAIIVIFETMKGEETEEEEE